MEEIGLSWYNVHKREIELLDALSLTRLMKKILSAEISKLKLKHTDLIVSLDITDPDDGLDAYIGCGIPPDHPFLPAGRSGWQFKAKNSFSKADIEKELLSTDKSDLKPRIKKLLSEDSAYVLVIGKKDFNSKQIDDKERRIRKIFFEKGFTKSQVKVFPSGLIERWVNSLPSVMAFINPERSHFKDIYEWPKTNLRIKEPTQFIVDLKIQAIIDSIREHISRNYGNTRATIIRVVGFPGVGKTRLVYEALNTAELRDLVLYVDTPDKLPQNGFNDISQNDENSGIIVVDECNHEKYVQITKELEGLGGRITLIALDFDIDKPYDHRDRQIIIQPLESKTTDKLVQSVVPGLSLNDRQKIIMFSEGYPRIAVLLSEYFVAHAGGLTPYTLNELGIASLFDALIAGRCADATKISKIRSVLTAVSLFKRLGWDEDVDTEGKHVCAYMNIEWVEAKLLLKEQEERGLIAKRGRYRYVTPLTLATYLASNWWNAMGSEAYKFLNKLPSQKASTMFLERLKDLPLSEHTKNVVDRILSSLTYEVLDTEYGSEIFLSLAKANRISAVINLERIIGHLSIEQLFKFSEGRRNVVSALERIAWWPDTFERASRILLKLACAENETWSNNATGVFAQLFQPLLGANAVPMWERTNVLLDIIISNAKNMQKIALIALSRSFDFGPSIGSCAAEDQGINILPPQWYPRNRQDIEKSFYSSLDVLNKALQVNDDEIRYIAAKAFLSNSRILLSVGLFEPVIEELSTIAKISPDIEKETIITIEKILYFEKKMPKNIIEKFTQLREQFVGTAYEGLMKRYVKSSLLVDQLDERKNIVDDVVVKLAKESIENPSKLEKELCWLVTDEAENGFSFGFALGQVDCDYCLLPGILQKLKESKKPSAFFLGGYLSSLKTQDVQLWEKTIDICYEDIRLKIFIPEIIWRSGASDKALDLLFRMLESKAIKPDQFAMFSYGAWFVKTSKEEFVSFLEKYYQIDKGAHSSTLFAIISQYINFHPLFIDVGKDVLFQHIVSSDVLSKLTNEMDMFCWTEIFKKFIAKHPSYIAGVLDNALEALNRNTNSAIVELISGVIEISLRINADIAWGKISHYLLESDLRSYRLIDIFKGKVFIKERQSLLGLVHDKKLLNWIEETPKARYVLARMIPLKEYEPVLHPLAKELLTRYGDDPEIKSALSSNWSTDVWVGPVSNHYKQKCEIAKLWKQEPNKHVASWAQDEINSLTKGIAQQKKREQEEM